MEEVKNKMKEGKKWERGKGKKIYEGKEKWKRGGGRGYRDMVHPGLGTPDIGTPGIGTEYLRVSGLRVSGLRVSGQSIGTPTLQSRFI